MTSRGINEPITQRLSLGLFHPGMTILHRVGLAGLVMSLEALAADDLAALRTHGDWQIGSATVDLEWIGDGEAFFERLFAASFRVSDEGLFWFPALGHPMTAPAQAVNLQNAILGTFLQHNRTRRAARQQTSIAVEIDGATLPLRYLPVLGYVHQHPSFRPHDAFPVAGWLYPGAVVRHTAMATATELTEEPALALPALFALIGALYFQVHRRAAGTPAQFCVVLPNVTDLGAYASARRLFFREPVHVLQVAGAAEAALRALTQLASYDVLNALEVDRCEVIAFGSTAWAAQQKTRVEVHRVEGVAPSSLRTYRIANALLPPRWVELEPAPGGLETRWFWSVPQSPALVAENVAAGDPWYAGFAAFWQSLRDAAEPGRRNSVLSFERRGLQAMIDDPRVTPDGPEVYLVRACHEAWRRRQGELGQRARDQGTDFGTLVGGDYERLRIGFAKCKNRAMLRKALTDFWSRTGSSSVLQGHWADILALIEHDWQKARDLALLSLASYGGSEGERADRMTASGEGVQEERVA